MNQEQIVYSATEKYLQIMLQTHIVNYLLAKHNKLSALDINQEVLRLCIVDATYRLSTDDKFVLYSGAVTADNILKDVEFDLKSLFSEMLYQVDTIVTRLSIPEMSAEQLRFVTLCLELEDVVYARFNNT